MKCRLLIPAAGGGTRLGSHGPKALVMIAGKPLIVRTVERFTAMGLVHRAVVAVPPSHHATLADLLGSAFPGEDLVVVDGGRTRQESVAMGLAHLDADDELVVIHDAARPFVSEESIRASIEAAREFGAATVAIPVTDTILERGPGEFLAGTPVRDALWACQTPQTFQVTVIREAHDWARESNRAVTDDATLVRKRGHAVKLVPGSVRNWKITHPEDLDYAEYLFRENLV